MKNNKNRPRTMKNQPGWLQETPRRKWWFFVTDRQTLHHDLYIVIIIVVVIVIIIVVVIILNASIPFSSWLPIIINVIFISITGMTAIPQSDYHLCQHHIQNNQQYLNHFLSCRLVALQVTKTPCIWSSKPDTLRSRGVLWPWQTDSKTDKKNPFRI